MQAVADLQILQLAQKSVELLQCLGLSVTPADAAIAVDAGGAGALQNVGGERRDPSRIAAQRLVIFVDQPLQFGLRAIAAGARQGRGQMVDDDGLRTALRLRPLTGVVDDERVEMRRRPEHRFGKTLSRQRERLSRQPFQGAVLAEIDHRVSAEAVREPGVRREIGMRRRQCRIVIGRLGVEIVAARRLHQHRDIAGAEAGDREIAAGEPARMEKRVAFRRAPLRRDVLLHGLLQAREKRRIFVERQAFLVGRLRARIRRASEQMPYQRGSVFRNVADAITGVA